jgi:predicted transposase YbfD/YdcC
MEADNMARVTLEKRIELDNEEMALAFFRRALSKLPDPRRRQGIRYPFSAVVTIALMAMVCGCDDAEGMESWGEANGEWLRSIFELPYGPPTQDVFLAIFAAINPESFSAVFQSWVDVLRVKTRSEGKHIAVDGKTSRRSFDTEKGQPAIHTVSAWLSDEGLVLGQRKTAAKSNEITAIPELLRTLDLSGATVTIDAMGCQTEIVKTITEGGGHCLLAVKENQPTLHADVVETFAQAADTRNRSVDEPARPTVQVCEESDKGHGRIEYRRYELCRSLDWMTTIDRWPGISFVLKATRERTVLADQTTSTETAYYIGSDPTIPVSQAGFLVRRHWSIENELHWVLDMAFREDEARHRAGNVAANLTTLRHFSLALLKRDPDRKLGIANSRKRAGWDRAYLLRILATERG